MKQLLLLFAFLQNIAKQLNLLLELGDYKDELILTTTHRFKYTLQEWIVLFRSRGIKVNSLERIETDLNSFPTRRDEIIDWISHHNIEEYLIIDDDKSLNTLSDKMKSNLILTDSYFGL